MWKSDDMKHKTLQLKELLDASIMKPHNIQIPGISNIIVDEFLEYWNFTDHVSYIVDEEIMKRGLGYLLECVTLTDHAVSGACEGGDLELMELIIQRSDNKGNDVNWDWCLLSACRGGHIPIIKLMLLNKNVSWGRYKMLEDACLGGHLPAIEFIIRCGLNMYEDWNNGLITACYGGHIHAIDLMIRNGANDWNNGLQAACHGKQIKAAKFMIQQGANDWNCALQAACRFNGCLPIIELILNHVDGEVIISSGMREIIEKLRNAQNKE